MKVDLIGITQPLGQYKHLSPEEFIISQARISNPENKLNTETMPKLLSYLIRHKHWSPFDLVSINFEIETSRDVGTQLLRHWNIDWQEFSQRYSEIPGVEDIELRQQGKTNRQVGEEAFDPELITLLGGKKELASQRITWLLEKCKDTYNLLIESGVAKECARRIMPLASTTTLIGHGSVRSWMSLLNQRLSPHAQKEIRQVANLIADYMIVEFPNLAVATDYFNSKQGDFM